MKKFHTSVYYAVLCVFVLIFLGTPSVAVGITTGDFGLQNPLDGIDSLMDLIRVIISDIIIPIGAVVVVIALIWSGFLFVKAQGKEQQLSEAKQTFLWTVIGAAILLGSWAISLAIEGTICEISPDLPGCGASTLDPDP